MTESANTHLMCIGGIGQGRDTDTETDTERARMYKRERPASPVWPQVGLEALR